MEVSYICSAKEHIDRTDLDTSVLIYKIKGNDI